MNQVKKHLGEQWPKAMVLRGEKRQQIKRIHGGIPLYLCHNIFPFSTVSHPLSVCFTSLFQGSGSSLRGPLNTRAQVRVAQAVLHCLLSQLGLGPGAWGWGLGAAPMEDFVMSSWEVAGRCSYIHRNPEFHCRQQVGQRRGHERGGKGKRCAKEGREVGKEEKKQGKKEEFPRVSHILKIN